MQQTEPHDDQCCGIEQWTSQTQGTAQFPGTTHYNVFLSPVLAAAAVAFLDRPTA